MSRTTIAAALALGLSLGVALTGCSQKSDDVPVVQGKGPGNQNTFSIPDDQIKPQDPANEPFCKAFFAAVTKGTSPTDKELPEYKKTWADVAATAPAAVNADVTKYNAYIQAATKPEDVSMNSQPADVLGAVQSFTLWVTQNCLPQTPTTG